jgi:hypothetical protein
MLTMSTDDFDRAANACSMNAPLVLENNLPTPPVFDLHATAFSKKFQEIPVVYPLGVEVSCINNLFNGMVKRARAPQPAAKNSTASNWLNHSLAAFVACNGITHIHPIRNGHLIGGTIIANLEKAELGHFTLTVSSAAASSAAHTASLANATPASATAAAFQTGPCSSQKSRAFSITLLLPTTVDSPRLSNNQHRTYLDAFTTLSQIPAKKKRFFQEVRRIWPSVSSDGSGGSETVCAHLVRFNVVAGKQACCDYIVASNATPPAGVGWKSCPAVVVTFHQHGALSPCYAKLNESSFKNPECPTVAEAVVAIQSAVSAIQLQSGGCLALPTSLLASEFGNSVGASLMEAMGGDMAILAGFESGCCTPSTSDGPGAVEEGSIWLALQVDLCRRFKELLLCPLLKEIERASVVIPKLGIGSSGTHRFCRFASRSMPWNNQDAKQSIGIIYSSNEEVLCSYLRRCRLAEPRQIFELLPLDSEELTVNISVLCFSFEVAHIGGDLSLFFPRPESKFGCNATEHDLCHSSRIVPSLVSLQTLLIGNYVVPVSTSSVQVPKPRLASMADFSSNLNKAFGDFVRSITDPLRPSIDDVVMQQGDDDEIRGTNGGFSLLGDDVPEDPHDATRNRAVSAILGAKLAHPVTTLNEAYSCLEEHGHTACLDGTNFHKIVTAGIVSKSFGGNRPLEELLEACADIVPVRDYAYEKFGKLLQDGNETVDELIVKCIDKFDTSVSLADDGVAPGSPKKRARTPEPLQPPQPSPPLLSLGGDNLDFLLKRQSSLVTFLAASLCTEEMQVVYPPAMTALLTIFKSVWSACGFESAKTITGKDEKKMWFGNFKASYRTCRIDAPSTNADDNNSDDKEKIEIKNGVGDITRIVGGSFGAVLKAEKKESASEAYSVFVVDEEEESASPSSPSSNVTRKLSKIELNGDVTAFYPRVAVSALLQSSETSSQASSSTTAPPKIFLVWSTGIGSSRKLQIYKL